ncbi:unnamed protein product [Parascedosporium putredinis]|uniref:VOC domain-containing protein n=1 Tax=Parascedosporium putredinis TaxID=1442378 RepID=A0A9P1MDT2_9PEZI|nr:unnamed protein product [Parascedosporium putredinis]CAI8000217.1 unnamed protein product [Parascedosporium putredinis]
MPSLPFIGSGRIQLPIVNGSHKIQLARLSHVYCSHPNLDEFDRFAKDFGFVEEARDKDTVYYRGYGKDLSCYAVELSGNSPVRDNAGPAGGRIVTLSSPSGTKIHVVWGMKERPAPTVAVSETEVEGGSANTALNKTRKGHFLRFKLGPAMVHKLGHYGFVTSMFDEDVEFYTRFFNFVPSDVLWEDVDGNEVDALTFMHLDQGEDYSDHHTLFLARAPAGFPVPHQIHHCSFEVEDFDTQLLGHEYLLSKSYTPVWGVGRHIYGSQIFDYWKDPSGFTIEHYADGDLVNKDNPTGRAKSDGPASMYIWGPVRPEDGVI